MEEDVRNTNLMRCILRCRLELGFAHALGLVNTWSKCVATFMFSRVEEQRPLSRGLTRCSRLLGTMRKDQGEELAEKKKAELA